MLLQKVNFCFPARYSNDVNDEAMKALHVLLLSMLMRATNHDTRLLGQPDDTVMPPTRQPESRGFQLIWNVLTQSSPEVLWGGAVDRWPLHVSFRINIQLTNKKTLPLFVINIPLDVSFRCLSNILKPCRESPKNTHYFVYCKKILTTLQWILIVNV